MSNSSVTGSVKFFNAAKGFGFIAPADGGKDVFVPAASIAASGLARLKAGQLVSFDLEPDTKGPKAVKLTVLQDAPAPAHGPAHTPAPAQSEIRQTPPPPAVKKTITVHVDTASANGAVDDVLEALSEAGETPVLVEVSATSREDLIQLSLLLREVDQSLVRRYDPLFLALQLDDRFISESDFWTAIVEHPSLVNGTVVAKAGKARICKSADDVKAFLGQGGQSQANGKPKGISPRMAALMRGESLPPQPKAPLPVAKAAEPKTAQPDPAPKVKEPVAAAKPAPAPVMASAPIPPKTPIKLPAKASVKKAAAPVKSVKKSTPAAAKAKKKK